MSPALARNNFGPSVETNGVRFRLWAPDAQDVALVINDRRAHPMLAQPSGFWEACLNVPPGTLYQFEVDGLKVADPASRFQPNDVFGPSQLVDDASYAWQNNAWRGRPWEQTIFYEVHAGLMGGYQGLRARLPELADLGVTALQIMPLNDVAGQRGWGYDGVLIYAPNAAYGTPGQLRALIDDAHGLGMMVFLDVVYNHFGPAGNFLPSYASPLFDPQTPTPWGPAIDFTHPVVRQFFTENALYWLDSYRFDGLRLDAVHAIADKSWLTELAETVRARITDRHVHLVVENEHNTAALLDRHFTAQWNDDFHNVMHVLLTGESHDYYSDFADAPAQRLARCLADGFIYQGEASVNHNGKKRGEPSAHLPATRFVSFLQNHDQTGNRAFGERLTVLAHPRALRAASALLLLCPHIPLLFMGEEVGAREPFLFFTDFHGDLAEAVREGRRREFSKAPGFGAGFASEAIPDPNAVATFEASRWTARAADAAEWNSLTADLLELRHDRIIPRLRNAKSAGTRVLGAASVLARWRMEDGKVLTIAANFSPDPVRSESLPTATPMFGDPVRNAMLPGHTTIAWLA